MEQWTTALGQWLKERCQKEHLSLRQAAAKTGLSQSTLAGIIKGSAPSPQTVRKLARGFSGGGNERLAPPLQQPRSSGFFFSATPLWGAHKVGDKKATNKKGQDVTKRHFSFKTGFGQLTQKF